MEMHKIITYPETRTVWRTQCISCLDSPRVSKVCLVSRKDEMVDKMVVEFGEKDHIRGIGCIGLQMHIGV